VKYVAITLWCACVPTQPHRPITNCSQPREKEPGHEYYGRSWNVARLGELISGESTLDDAKCALGRPMGQSLTGDGLVVTWKYTDITPGQSNPKVDLVSISFASDGVMKEIVARSNGR
jgi:hypothetical protein